MTDIEIHHIGYMVKHMRSAIAAFQKLGYQEETGPVTDPDRLADICFMVNGAYRVELIAPEKQSPLYETYKKVKNSPYHICYASSDLAGDLEMLKQDGFMVVLEPARAVAFGGANVAFLVHRSIGLIEVAELK